MRFLNKQTLGITILSLLLVMGLSGCASMSRDECLAANWYEIGKKDASRGFRLARLSEHRESCAEHGIAPSVAEYRDGYSRGLPFYCNREKGWSVGLNGQSYHNICPPELEREFQTGYRAGREIHDLEQELDEIDRRIDRVEQKMAKSGLSEERGQELRRQLSGLVRDARRLERELANARAEARHRGFYR
jgi:hypothetical protein